jgi:hypothetical protein
MKEFSIAFRYNGWLRFGWISFLAGCFVLGFSIWYFMVNIDDIEHPCAIYLVEISFGVVAFSLAVIRLTRNGHGTLRTFRKSVRLIEHNKRRIAADMQPLRFPWEVGQWATTYCQRAGVKAAAFELNFSMELPPRYQKWWCIFDTRSRICPNRR